MDNELKARQIQDVSRNQIGGILARPMPGNNPVDTVLTRLNNIEMQLGMTTEEMHKALAELFARVMKLEATLGL